MSTINNTNAILQSQLESMAIMNQIGTAVAVKAKDAAQMTGDAMVAMIDQAGQMAKSMAPGLGENIDIDV